MRILFVDNDIAYRTGLAEYLAARGCEVACFDRFPAPARLRAEPGLPLLLLDLAAGPHEGLAYLRAAVAIAPFPIIVVAGRLDEAERVLSLETGADDHVLKATPPREILARIRAVTRRSLQPVASLAPPVLGGVAGARVVAGWRFDTLRRTLARPDGAPVPLTTAEFNLLCALVQNEGEPVGREALFARVFNRPFNPLDRAVDNLVAKLRGKLGEGAREPSMIRTVRPVGYVFTGFADASVTEDYRQAS